MNYFYANEKGQRVGPFSLQQLEELHAKGLLKETALVIRDAETKWSPLVRVLGEGRSSLDDSSVPVLEEAFMPRAPGDAAMHELSVDARRIVEQARSETDEFSRAPLVHLPRVKFGGVLAQQSGYFLTRFTRSKSDAKVGAVQLYVFVYYGETFSTLILYDTAHARGGLPLEVIRVNSEHDENLWKEDLVVVLPDTLLWKHVRTGLDIQISRPDMGKKLVIEISPSYVEATLATRFADQFRMPSGTSGTRAVSSPDWGFTEFIGRVPLWKIAVLVVALSLGALALTGKLHFLSTKLFGPTGFAANSHVTLSGLLEYDPLTDEDGDYRLRLSPPIRINAPKDLLEVCPSEASYVALYRGRKGMESLRQVTTSGKLVCSPRAGWMLLR